MPSQLPLPLKTQILHSNLTCVLFTIFPLLLQTILCISPNSHPNLSCSQLLQLAFWLFLTPIPSHHIHQSTVKITSLTSCFGLVQLPHG